jgi:hypothetical protein
MEIIRIKDLPNTLNVMGNNDTIVVEDDVSKETRKMKKDGIRDSINTATSSLNGLMSKEDKSAFDNLKSGFTVDGIQGGSGIKESVLKEWTRAESFSGIISKTSTSPVSIKWPDGSLGTFTATVLSDYGIDAFTITHINSGKTVRQNAITRDINGVPTVIPDLLIA